MYVLYMYVFICLMYCTNLSDNLLPKVEPAEKALYCVRCEHMNRQRCRLSPVCTVAVPCIFLFVVVVVIVAGAAVCIVHLGETS